MFALLVFFSCENKAIEEEETKIKTALNYMAGKAITTTIELNDEDLGIDLDMPYYMGFSVAFDENGKLSANEAVIKDFNGTVDGIGLQDIFQRRVYRL